MFPYYYPSSSSYGAAYPSSSSADAEYLRALAEERAAREQYAAAKRAQEEARQRAARARAARRAYAAPYNSFHEDEYDDLDLDMDLEDAPYYPPRRPLSYAGGQRPYAYPGTSAYSSSPQYPTSPQFSSSPRYPSSPQFANGAYGLTPRQQRALLEEQQRRELLEEQRRRELLELERERRRQEEERIRRILEEERKRDEAERRKILEEERKRRAMEEEKLRRAIEEEKLRRAMLEEEAARRERDRAQLRAQQASLEPLLRAFGFVPISPNGSESDSDKERGRGRNGRATRARTTSPGARRASMPRSPIRPTQSGQPSTSPTHLRPEVPSTQRAPSPKATTIPITSPRSSAKTVPSQQQAKESPKQQETPKHQEAPQRNESPKPKLPSLDNPTAEQVAAAEKIQDAYRTYSVRKQALKSIATLRKRFLQAKANFTLPTTLDYETSAADGANPDGRSYTTVSVDPSAALPSPSLSAADEHDHDPFKHVPKLAYTPTNAALHGYEEELNRILSALDAIESRGDAGVRAARRELARMVEREAERVDRWRGVVWNWWTNHRKEQAQEMAQEEQPPTLMLDDDAAPSTGEAQPAPVDQPEPVSIPAEPVAVDELKPASVEQPESQPVAEQEMQVEPSSEQPSEQPMETEPVAEVSTPTVAPMEVERAPEVPAEEQSPPTPEVDIPDAETSEPAPVDIEIEPASRAEPADVDIPPASDSNLTAAAPEVPIVEVSEEPDRPSTPTLTYEHSETDAEMEVEPQEVHTPPPSEHTPLVVVNPGLDLQEPAASTAPQPHEPEPQAQEQQKTQPVSVKSGGASPLVDRAWDEFYAHDMF
ncbi:hypothetical protein BN946_scf184989.g50 [Trametes cinnabarina]|uniref:BAG domain-containing protein n=1 Tax=Pycnoporus cinnabarinus TaxID=5643 RepID=A0A060S958_PYCCI|nr:hypothetical protein BN946_scf184989.g50 [Trametes cinnabarina]